MSNITSITLTAGGLTKIFQEREIHLKCDDNRLITMRRTISVGADWVKTGAWR